MKLLFLTACLLLQTLLTTKFAATQNHPLCGTKTPVPPPPPPFFSNKNKLVANSKFKSHELGLVGGVEAPAHSWPWMVSIGTYFSKYHYFYPECAGLIIASQWLLTAGQCISYQSPPIPDNWTALVGAHDVDLKVVNRNETHRRMVPFAKAIRHPHYLEVNSSGGSYPVNDIGLIKLVKPLDLFHDYTVAPICLPEEDGPLSGYDALLGHNVATASWGNPLRQVDSYLKQQIAMPVASMEWCQQRFAILPQYREAMLCTYDAPKMGACDGDGGAPLMLPIQDSAGRIRWTVMGLSSWGTHKCALSGYPDVNTNVSHYSTWVWKTVKEN